MQSSAVLHVKKNYGHTIPDEAKRLRHLGKENAHLLRSVGQQHSLIEAVKEVLAKSENNP